MAVARQPRSSRPSPRTPVLVRIYLDRYLRVGEKDRAELLETAAVYDRWFIGEFVPWLEKQLTVKAGAWQQDDLALAAIPAAALRIKDAATTMLLRPAVEWMAVHFRDYWREGWELWRLNRDIANLPTPRRLTMTQAEASQIASYVQRELDAWTTHVDRHTRQVTRAIGQACSMNRTTADFITACTSPDGHVIGFPQGASRYSWHEQIRRFVVGRPRLLAQAAVEYRAARMPEWRPRNG
jgi:hypothetical protein